GSKGRDGWRPFHLQPAGRNSTTDRGRVALRCELKTPTTPIAEQEMDDGQRSRNHPRCDWVGMRDSGVCVRTMAPLPDRWRSQDAQRIAEPHGIYTEGRRR